MNKELEIRSKKQSFCLPVGGEREPGMERVSNQEAYVLMAPSVPGDMTGFQPTHGRKLAWATHYKARTHERSHPQ